MNQSAVDTGFNYIDDDLQNLKQLLSFRLDKVMPQESPNASPRTHNDVQVVTMETRPNAVVVVNNRPIIGECSSSTSLTAEEQTLPEGPVTKPPWHYADLIEFALRDKEGLTVSEIYDWISLKFPYFKYADESKWKPAVRHTLTTNSSFYKSKKATRGYLWAYHSPEKQNPARHRNVVHSDGRHTSRPLWKSSQRGLSSGESCSVTSTVAGPTMYHPITVHIPETKHKTAAMMVREPAKKKRKRSFIPAVPILSHATHTIVLESSDNDSDNDDSFDATRGHRNCHLEYFIPKIPSDLNASVTGERSALPPLMPCCSGDGEHEGCHLSTSASTHRQIYDCFSQRQPSRDNRRDHSYGSGTLKRAASTVSPPSVQHSQSGHLLCMPITLPVYKNKILNKKDSSAPLNKVSPEVAVRESGLLEAPGGSCVAVLPSMTSLHTTAVSPHDHLDEIFPHLDETRLLGNSSFCSLPGVSVSPHGTTV